MPYVETAPMDAYIIALGVNDFDKNSYPKGDINDLYSDTFAGWYNKVIVSVRAISPEAPIFLVTRPKMSILGNDYDSWNDIIRESADLYDNVYVIDLYRYAPIYNTKFREKYYQYDHMNESGYALTSELMISYLDYIIEKENL